MHLDDSRPIWAQLVDEFHRRIASGQWPSGHKLPSVRELALELGVNPNTVQKALGEVDRLGLTAPERTAGRFVTADDHAIEQVRQRIAGAQVTALIDTAASLGMTLADITELLTHTWAAHELPRIDRKDPR